MPKGLTTGDGPPRSLKELAADKSLTHTEYRRLKVAQRLMARLSGGIADKALTWLETEIERDGPKAYDAAKLALEYTLGRPKQQVDVTAKVEHSHKVHLDVLRDMTLKQVTQGRVTIDNLPNPNSLKSLDNSEGDDVLKPDVLRQDGTAPQLVSADSVTADSAGTPPGGGGNTGGGVREHPAEADDE